MCPVPSDLRYSRSILISLLLGGTACSASRTSKGLLDGDGSGGSSGSSSSGFSSSGIESSSTSGGGTGSLSSSSGGFGVQQRLFDELVEWDHGDVERRVWRGWWQPWALQAWCRHDPVRSSVQRLSREPRRSRGFVVVRLGGSPGRGSPRGSSSNPMIWSPPLPAASKIRGAKYLLTFNEPDNGSQSNVSPTQAASLWPQIESIAATDGIPYIVSPAVASSVTWMQQFFNACTGCKVDYIAVHFYGCLLDTSGQSMGSPSISRNSINSIGPSG